MEREYFVILVYFSYSTTNSWVPEMTGSQMVRKVSKRPMCNGSGFLSPKTNTIYQKVVAIVNLKQNNHPDPLLATDASSQTVRNMASDI